jgi:hypothetical protein
LALPMAAWADGFNFTNQEGSIALSAAGITTTGSELLSWGSVSTTLGHSIGRVYYSVGPLVSGSVTGGGVFSSTGSTFDIVGRGTWAKSLPGYSHGSVTLFSGSFTGPVTWTLTATGPGERETFTLSGNLIGTLYTGRTVTGWTTQTILTYRDELKDTGTGHIGPGGGSITVPEPGTLSLLGTGLVGMAGMLRRKLLGS